MDNTDARSSSAPSFGVLTDWAIESSTHYAIAIVLFFALGLLGRFLGAVKAQLERKWNATRSNRFIRHEGHVGFQIEESEEFQPLKPETPTVADGKRLHDRSFWVADEAWNVQRDGIRAVLDFARAVIAYIL